MPLILLRYYLFKKAKDYVHLLTSNVIQFTFVLGIAFTLYYSFFTAMQKIEYIKNFPNYTLLSFIITFIIYTFLTLYFSALYKERELYYFLQFSLEPSKYITLFLIKKLFLSCGSLFYMELFTYHFYGIFTILI